MHIHRFAVAILLASAIGCHGQSAPPPASNNPATPSKLDRRIQLTIRSQYNVPPDYTVTLGQRSKSDISGFDSLPVTFSNGHGGNKTTVFLISNDNNTLARLEKFDLTKNPAATISTLGRPVRGNRNAKVTVINFDDLECPFCARMQSVLFPATMQHYGNQVRFIYMNFPLVDLHPWAMHAAVDVDCLATQSQPGYWDLVDYIHAHGSEISGERGQENISASFQRLDQATRNEGKLQHVDTAKLDACIAKQDESDVRASMKQGDALGIDGTPTLFVNGERSTGAVPEDQLWTIIDRAIRDAGEVPPPRSAATTPAAAPAPAK